MNGVAARAFCRSGGRFFQIGVSNDGVRRAEINSDQIAGCAGSSDDSALPAHGELETVVFHDPVQVIRQKWASAVK